MADFSVPLADAGERRLPNATEKEQGFLCGAADRQLFNGLFHRLEAELGDLIGYAGITPEDGNNSQVRTAILTLIDAATGGNPAGYILETQARARLPIYPEIINADGRINVSTPVAGTIRIPGGVNFLHRGIFQVTTTQADFATDASKTYHLRWDPTNGFRLRDLAAVSYNPGALPEGDVAFDSVYDDMLIARVVTNSSNVATITNLANKNKLIDQSAELIADAVEFTYGTPDDALQAQTTWLYNWARRPLVSVNASILSTHSARHQGTANWVNSHITTRYGSFVSIITDFDTNIGNIDGIAHGRFRFFGIA